MRVQDLMTAPALTIGPEASLKDVAAIFVERGISGLPVCDAENHVLGVVSEADILYQESGPEPGRADGFLRWLADARSGGSTKSQAQTVREAMTSPAITVSPWSSASEAARLLTTHGINRLPVVKGDELVGIVTRTDLVRAFTRSDEEIERELRDDVVERTLWLEPDAVAIEVKRGVVKLAGRLQTREDAAVLERLARRVPGVVWVTNDLTWNVEDAGWRQRLASGRRTW